MNNATQIIENIELGSPKSKVITQRVTEGLFDFLAVQSGGKHNEFAAKIIEAYRLGIIGVIGETQKNLPVHVPQVEHIQKTLPQKTTYKTISPGNDVPGLNPEISSLIRSWFGKLPTFTELANAFLNLANQHQKLQETNKQILYNFQNGWQMLSPQDFEIAQNLKDENNQLKQQIEQLFGHQNAMPVQKDAQLVEILKSENQALIEEINLTANDLSQAAEWHLAIITEFIEDGYNFYDIDAGMIRAEMENLQTSDEIEEMAVYDPNY